ncbi:helix-turn-helix domain-containing protein [Microbacterium lacus]|uniref:helix-turn-helix domain-containing protein n=1 Tax=Microbacterium lacus TaxID=415217 RepID=UPI00384E4310
MIDTISLLLWWVQIHGTEGSFRVSSVSVCEDSGIMSYSGDEKASFGLACWQGATRGMTAAHRHDDLEFNHADVDLEYVIDGRTQVIPAGTIAVFWAARPHQLVGGEEPGIETWLTLPLHRALAWRLPASFMLRMLGGEVVALPGGPGLGLHEGAPRWSGELQGAGVRRRVAELEIQAFALRVADRADQVRPLGAPSTDGGRGAPRESAAAMAAFLSDRSSDDITVSDVAAHVHLNPQYAMTVFRSALGITIGEYLAQSRVAAAQQLLLTTDTPVPDVGFAAGFRSQSQFYERFGRWCGETPAAYRRRLRSV